MAKKKGEVKFIRKNGRIIPIRTGKKNPKNTRESRRNRQLLGGLVTSISGGVVSLSGGKVAKKAADLSKKAGEAAGKANRAAFKADQTALKGTQLDFFRVMNKGLQAQKLRKRASKLRSAAVRFENVSSRAKLITIGVGGSLIGAGIENVLDSSDAKRNPAKEISKDFVVNVASGVAAGAFLLGSHKAGVRKGSKELLNRLKTSVKRRQQLKFKF